MGVGGGGVKAVNNIYFHNITALGTDLLPQSNLLASQQDGGLTGWGFETVSLRTCSPGVHTRERNTTRSCLLLWLKEIN